MTDEPSESEPDRNEAGERLHAAHLAGIRDFSNAQFADLTLTGVDLSNSDFTGTSFDNCVLDRVTFNEGVLDRARFARCNLSYARFHGASLKDVDFSPSILRRADFYMASLRGANFLNCDARDTYFGAADLRDASLYGGQFSGAWFLLTNLNGATLVGANLADAIVKGFNIINSETIVKNARLLQQTLGQRKQFEAVLARATPAVEGLAMVIARDQLPPGEEPATMTEVRRFLERLDSEFESLRRFLLASGCDAEEVAQMGEAAEKSRTEYPRVFISYSTEDERFAARLHTSLTEFGVDAWFAPENMRGGRKIDEQVKGAIAERDKIILVLSEASLKSRWVASEIQWAAGREIESGHQILFPIRIVPFEAVRKWTLFDADLGQDIAKYVRQYFVPDFSEWWDEEALARITERFLRDLRLSQADPPVTQSA